MASAYGYDALGRGSSPAPETSAVSGGSVWFSPSQACWLAPVIVMIHRPIGEMTRDFLLPRLPKDAKLNEDVAGHRDCPHDGRSVAAILPRTLYRR
jgi:hypothetical protein